MITKRCPGCREVKPAGDFHFKNKSLGTLASYCKLCQKARARSHYQRNTQIVKDKVSLSKKVYLERNREYVYNYLRDHPCVDCGESDPVVLEFDHVSGHKEKAVSRLVGEYCGAGTLQSEISKCVVRCANCHRRKTALTLKHWRSTRNV